MDQTAIIFTPGADSTYNKKRAKQVHLLGKNEKKAYTLAVACSCARDVLPFQAVWGGKTMASCPKVVIWIEAESLGFNFTPANSVKNLTSHFSTLPTMREWIEKIYISYIKSIVQEHNLKPDQKSIFLLDAYLVHISLDFRTYLQAAHPNAFIIYIPANCIGQFQPADVSLQRVIKHHLK